MPTKKSELLNDKDLDQIQGGIAKVQSIPVDVASPGDFKEPVPSPHRDQSEFSPPLGSNKGS